MLWNPFNLLFSAVLVYLSFPNRWTNEGFWFLAWISLVPLMRALQGQLVRQRAAIGLLFGGSVYCLLVAWLFPVHGPAALAFVLALTAQPILFCVFYSREITRPLGEPQKGLIKNIIAVLFVPALWAASEWSRTFLLQGFTWGLSYSQSFQPALIQPAAFTGSYGVSFAIVLINAMIYRALRVSAHRGRVIVLACFLFVVLYTCGVWRIETKEKEHPSAAVCAIQPNIPPSRKTNLRDFDDNLRQHMDLTAQAVLERKPDIIVWPETAFAADIFKDRLWYPRLRQIAANNKSSFVFGAVPIVGGKSFNSAVVLDERGELNGVYDKQFLVPVSEYRPEGISGQWFKPLLAGRSFDFTAGQKSGIFSLRDGKIRFGLMICSETGYPSLARELANHGAGFILAILNDGWFLRPEAIMMHAQNSVFRAVESGLDVVSVGNTGWTGSIDRYGVVRRDQQFPLQQETGGVLYVSPRPSPTFYSQIGDLFAGACSLFVIMLLIFRQRILKI